jgi:hypothetical protein
MILQKNEDIFVSDIYYGSRDHFTNDVSYHHDPVA